MALNLLKFALKTDFYRLKTSLWVTDDQKHLSGLWHRGWESQPYIAGWKGQSTGETNLK